MTKAKKETMFVMIAGAVKKLQSKTGYSEDRATDVILGFLRTFPDDVVMDLDVLARLLNAIVQLESETPDWINSTDEK